MKKSNIVQLSVAMFLLACFYSSCYYDNEEALYPSAIINTNCDLSNVTFTNHVLPIFRAYCLSCHSSSEAQANGGGFTFETYAQISAKSATILASIKHTNSTPMPQGGGKLDDCKISQIEKWISNGLPNN